MSSKDIGCVYGDTLTTWNNKQEGSKSTTPNNDSGLNLRKKHYPLDECTGVNKSSSLGTPTMGRPRKENWEEEQSLWVIQFGWKEEVKGRHKRMGRGGG